MSFWKLPTPSHVTVVVLVAPGVSGWWARSRQRRPPRRRCGPPACTSAPRSHSPPVASGRPALAWGNCQINPVVISSHACDVKLGIVARANRFNSDVSCKKLSLRWTAKWSAWKWSSWSCTVVIPAWSRWCVVAMTSCRSLGSWCMTPERFLHPYFASCVFLC